MEKESNKEWVDWSGGECPVEFDSVVQIRTNEFDFEVKTAFHVNWKARHGKDKIYVEAYRVIF